MEQILFDDFAKVDINGALVDVNITLMEELKINEYVLVHTGFAIEKYDEVEAEKTLEMIREAFKIERV